MSPRTATAIVLLTVAGSVSAQTPPPPTSPIVENPPAAGSSLTPSGFQLAPGEVLVEVDGRPVNGGRQLQVQSSRVPAPTGCPTCARTTYQTNVPAPTGQGLRHQATARARARYMARYNYRNHPPGSFGTNFEGVGWSSNPNATPPTCIPGRRGGVQDTSGPGWVLVGDAIERGPRGAYRVRLWNRAGNSTSVSTAPTSGRRPGIRRGGFFRRLFRR